MQRRNWLPSDISIPFASYACPRFWMNAERDFNELARYYGIPAVGRSGTPRARCAGAACVWEQQVRHLDRASLAH